jgi:hypothetical protein
MSHAFGCGFFVAALFQVKVSVKESTKKSTKKQTKAVAEGQQKFKLLEFPNLGAIDL